ncbi:hypothetical protein [Actinomadura opuntiae]|uniref:hypothetical protein n=1 Tax=Actinomadura sp. OS1-43 TaxID=604315 RepID=UPI00255AC195|nr:hypothetical protein [Actinomadura sp. OS1-43]MDL4817225.1 hypothetical protein [Actinomadura sp. OS1-43]
MRAAETLIRGLPAGWRMGKGTVRRAVPLAAAALAHGWTETDLRRELTGDMDGVRTPSGVAIRRLQELPPPDPRAWTGVSPLSPHPYARAAPARRDARRGRAVRCAAMADHDTPRTGRPRRLLEEAVRERLLSGIAAGMTHQAAAVYGGDPPGDVLPLDGPRPVGDGWVKITATAGSAFGRGRGGGGG